MLKKFHFLLTGIFFLVCMAGTGRAKLTPKQIDRLDKDLTPLGATRAGNKDGTIPQWTGGIVTWPAGFKPEMRHINPFKDDPVRFTITRANMNQYADKLTEGHKTLLKTYGDYRMKVYPTRRSASYPQRIYDVTKKIAATAELVSEGEGVRGAINGIPFPIPKNGLEVIWNHLLRYRGDTITRRYAQAMPTRQGDYTLVTFKEKISVIYSQKGMTETALNNRISLLKQVITAPARLAGGILLVHDTLNQVKEPRNAWLYNPGQRRVRRAPTVDHDNPGTASDGMRTTDQYDMFSGATDRYNWKLVGKKVMFVPYNSYLLHSDSLTFKDILTPLFPNPEYCRFELHRVWIVEATLKPGKRHIYKRRTFYVDEDTWHILVVDQYDSRDQLWRVSEAHVLNYYEVPATLSGLEVHTDLHAGRYLAILLNNEYPMYIFNEDLPYEEFTPAALRRAGRR